MSDHETPDGVACGEPFTATVTIFPTGTASASGRDGFFIYDGDDLLAWVSDETAAGTLPRTQALRDQEPLAPRRVAIVGHGGSLAALARLTPDAIANSPAVPLPGKGPEYPGDNRNGWRAPSMRDDGLS